MAGWRIFIAEDNAIILLSLEMLLEQNGFTLAGSATSVEEAVHLAETVEADVAILDVNLHSELIFPAADVLFARGIPFVFITGHTANLPPRFASVPTIYKPYQFEVMLQHIEQAATASAQ